MRRWCRNKTLPAIASRAAIAQLGERQTEDLKVPAPIPVSLLEQSVYVGENPVFRLMPAVHGTCSQSHAPRNWSVNWVVNFI